MVELAARIPPRMKLKGLREKHILRRALGRHLPAAISDRPKQPYRAPDSESFAGEAARALVDEMLAPGRLAAAGCFNPAAVAKLAAKCRAGGPIGVGDNMAFVGILSTQLLHSQYACASRRRAEDAPVVALV